MENRLVGKGEISLLDADIMVSQKAAKAAAGCAFFDLWISLSQNTENDPSSSEGVGRNSSIAETD